MPYASSIQIVNDANGTAHAFLEVDGLLWQCQWNPEAQRWDKGQVVPGAYGGEKLQALLVDNLWPTSGSTGNTSGNTPGIVLAYRVGEGDNATVQATLGGWGSDGQLSWSEPLQLVGSGSAIEEIHLAQTQAGEFQLVYQGRDPLGAGSASALKAEGSGSTPQNDSDLLFCKFELEANGASTETSYNLVNKISETPSPINFFESSSLITPQAQFSGGGSSFSRSDLQFSQAPATATYGLLSARSSATDPAASNSAGSRGFTQGGKINLSYQRQNSKKTNTATAGLNWSDQQVRWQFEPYKTSKSDVDVREDKTLNQNLKSKWNDDLSVVKVFQNFSFRNGQTIKISGSFGAFTFGQQSAISSASLSWTPLSKKSDKVKAENLSSYLKNGANATSKSTLQGSLSGSLATTYSFQKLSPWSGENYLKKITQKANVSVGLKYDYKKMVLSTEVPSIINAQASVEAGFVFINTISPSPQATSAASAFPNWIRNAGDFYAYAGGALGLGEGVYGGLQARSLKETKKIDSFGKYDQLKRQPGRRTGVDIVLGGTGFSGIILPDFLYSPINANQNNQLQSTQQYGLSLSTTFSGTFLLGGLIGPNLIIKDTFQYFPRQNPYLTNILTVAANLVTALGPKVSIFSDTWKWQKSAKSQNKSTKSLSDEPSSNQAASQNSLPGDTSSLSTSAISNSGYPFYYEPSQGSILLAGSDLNSVQPLAGGSPYLQLLTLSGYSAGVLTVETINTPGVLPTPVVLQNAGSGLNDGDYSNVAVMGISLPGSAPATLDFTVANGAIVANTIVINSPGTGAGLYLQLPETSLGSGVYVLIPDVFSTGTNSVPILPIPAAGSSVATLDLLPLLPVITVDTSRTGSPLPKNPPSILAIQPEISLATPITSATYPNQTPSDNSLISYSNVAIQINNNSITLLNQATATVSLSNGTIVRVVLDQPLYLQSSDATTSTEVDLTLDMQAALGSSVTNPTYSVTLQAVGLNNVVEDNSFSANSANTGSTWSATSPAQAVWLANGVNDQLQATPSQAAWPVFNRVVVQAYGGALTYLNSSTTSSDTGAVTQTVTLPSGVELNTLYATFDPKKPKTFSAASTPTAITISGPPKASYTGDSVVFWVEASEPVIPQTATDGSQNYQAFMNALYGNQRINYRIFTQTTEGWSVPNTLDLYSPTNAVIRNLKAFQVDMGGSEQTLLVWDETSIDTIKGNTPKPIAINGWIVGNQLSLSGLTTGLRNGDLITGDGVKKGTLITGIVTPFDAGSGTAVYSISSRQDVGSSSQPVALNAYPLLPPTVLKAGFINPAANNYQWLTLFSDSNGNSTITTIPWDQANDIGLGIESLSVASQQTVDASGNFQTSALLTWSQDVRTPYGQAVLNDEPLIYLQFGDLQPGFNSINFGSTGTSNTGTVASSTGLDFTVPSALPKSSASAVQNIDGTGVLSTGTGSQNALYESVINNTPVDQLPSSPFAQLTASITGTTLTVTALSGNLDQGDLLTGPGLQPDTQIIGVLSGFDPTTGTGTYSINQSQNLSSASFEALPNQAPLSNKELGLPYSSFIGSINGATLNVSQLSGSLAVRDRIYGEGVSEGTSITEVISFDSSTGTGSYTLSQSQQQLSAYALIATPPISSAPYTIEFWTQLPALSNGDQGAGLVAFGQPSPAAVGGYEAPSGWLLSASFSVAQITYQLAAAQGSQDAYDQLNSNKAQPSDLFAWGWSLDATGANTTALGGNGGSNLYSNSLTINNLANGQTIAGVNAFLANYGLTAADLVGGDGLYANSIDLVPGISLDFNNSLNPNTGLPVSNLNAVNIDTTSAPLNSGLVAINANGDLNTDPATNQNLQNMFQSLWNYQVQYGEAKVGFTLNPEAAPQPGSGFEQYGGYTLDFTVAPGPAISVNQQGQLVFDVADGVSITSAATNPSDNRQSPLPSDLRDGDWHYVVATYLPDFRPYTINGVATQVPVDRGTASLYVDNQLVASASGVSNPYVASNINDTALLLANNAGGAIDQFAVYNEALLPAPPLPSGGFWPEVSQQDVLGILKELGYPATEQTPNPGAIESAISSHWSSRNVNPNDALLGTYSSNFTPSSPGSLLGSWSEAAPLNPITQPQATAPSATASSLQQDLVISIAPSDWGKNSWFVGSNPQADPFNPANQELETVTLVLTSTSDGTETTITRTLSPEQVLMGSNTIESLQATASISDFNYTLLSATPALNLVVSRKPNPKQSGDGGEIKAAANYSAKVTLNFTGNISVSNTSGSQTGLNLSLNSAGAGLIQSIGSATTNTNLTNRSTALATAEVIEASPLQLKYIDSGVVLHSASSQAAANSPSISSPAQTFGQSQAFGWFETSTANNYSSWLAIAQPTSANASSNPAGRVWIQYTGDFTSSNAATSTHTAVTDANKAPITWLDALANSNFTPENPNLPLINSATYKASYGGLLIQADPTAGWGQNFGQTMLVANIVGNNSNDLVISAPNANGGGKVIIIDGTWIASNLTNTSGSSILNLSNPENLGSYVTVLSPPVPSGTAYENDDASQAAFGWALAVDESTSTLWIGAPNYSREVGPANESVPIGALYTYQKGNLSSNYAVGMAGSTSTNDLSGPLTTYWGSQLGASLAFSAEAGLAVGAPGVQASMLYSGTEAAEQAAALNKVSSTAYGQGALVKIMLPTPLSSPSSGIDVSVSSSDGTSNAALVDVIANNPADKTSALAQEESTYMQALKNVQTKSIAKANTINNPAIQTAAVGSVYLFKPGANLPTGTLTPASASKTFYGPNPWNTIGGSDFGASLSFADIKNTNQQNILAIGAPQAGGSGAVYLLNTSQAFNNETNLGSESLGENQYLAYLTSALTLYGAEEFDAFGNGTLNLGDTNNDGYDDLLIQAFNAASGAGNGYVIFGGDTLIADIKNNTNLTGSSFNPAVGNVRTSNMGRLNFADGSSYTTPILAELGYGISAATGQGSYGAGDINSDGLNDIPLGSGPNGSSYLTWGHSYLEAITNLQLSKLASNTGYLLDGLATTTQGSLRSIGDFNGDGYGDFISINPGSNLTTVRIELGANTQEILADYAYEYYTFTVANGTEVLPGGDINGDGMDDIVLFLDQNLSSAAEGNQGAGSSTGILYGRNSDDLPLGSGFGFIAMVDPSTSAPLAPLPGDALGTGLTDAAPSVIAVGDTLYAAVKGVGSTTTSIWFTQSTDGGNTWNGWTDLTSSNAGFSTSNGPSLAFYNEKLYLSFLNTDSTPALSLSSWDPTSNNPTAWSTPYQLSNAANPSVSYSSKYSPQLIERGDALGVVWVGPPTLKPVSAWSPLAGAAVATPALAQLGNTIFMVTMVSGGIYYNNGQQYNYPSTYKWTTSTDDGASWAEWQDIEGVYGYCPPSLAVMNGTLYLSCTDYSAYNGTGTVFLTSFTPGTSAWSAPTVVPTTYPAVNVSIIAEVVNSVQQLGIYYTNLNSNSYGSIRKTYSSTPASVDSWPSTDVPISSQAASGPLAVTSFQGQTYIAYQKEASSNPSNDIYVTTSSSAATTNDGSDWTAKLAANAGTTTGLGLTSDGNNLILSYGDAASPADLQIVRFTSQAGKWSVGSSYSEALPAGLSNNVAILGLQAASGPQLLLAGTTIAASSNAVQTGIIENFASYPNLYAANSTSPDGANAATSWSSPTELLQRIDDNGAKTFLPINASDAPSFTWLGDVPVLALNNNGTINVYAGTQSGATLELTSSFTAPAGLSIVSAPVLTTTDTGLALTYTNSDDSITLQRLNFVSSSGAPLPGVQFNSDGSINTSNADLQWQSTTLTAANSGISTALASTPVSVNGNLLLTNVRNSSTLDNQIWINAVPNASNPDSTTWLNSTVQLPDTSGGWILSQQAGANNLTSAQTGSTISAIGDINADGFDDLAITANGVVYNNQHTTGVRFVLGAATATAFSSANDATAENQTVQIASLYPQFQIGATPVANLSGPTTLNLNGALGGSRYQISSTAVSTSASPLSNADVTATSSNPSSLQQLFAGAKSKSLGDTFPYTFDGNLSLQALAGYGDLNGDGYADYLALDGLDYVSTASGTISFSVWSIRAAGDVNGNGLDDVLLTLAPKGPAYVAAADGSPTALQSVLVDGALFKVDTKNNTFSLANLKNPLNPYNSGEIYDVTSDSNSQFLPLLQNWFEPILTFEPGSLPTKATIGFEPGGLNIPPAYDFVIPIESHINQIPDSIKTQVAPAVVVDAMGNPTLFYPGSTSGSGIWCATLDIATRNWSQFSLPSALNNVNYLYSPSAAIYGDTLYLAYIDNSGNLYIAYTKANTDGQPNYYESADWNSYQVVTTQDESSAYSPALVVEEGRLALYFASNMPSSGSSNDYGRTQQLRYLYSNNPDADNPSWGSSLETSSSAKPAPYSGVSGNLTFAQGTNTDQYTVSSSISATTYQGRTVLAMTGNGGGNSNSVASIRIATAPSANPAPGDNWLYWANPTASADYLNGNGYIGITTDQSLLYISTALGTEISQDSTSTPDSLPSYTNTSQVYSLSPSQALGTYNISSSYNGPKGVNRVSNPNIFMYQGVPILAWANSSQIPLIDDLEMVAGAPLQPSLAGYSIDGNIDVNGDGFTDILISDPSDPSEGVDNQYVLFGGDYLNIASQVGTAGNDTLIGTPLADVIYTLSGDDVVYANGGADVIYTGSGNDQIAVKANGTVDSSTGTQQVTGNKFIRIDGGSGFDQLLLEGLSDQAYYFQLATPSSSTIFAGTKLKDIELISSVDYGSNTLNFDAAAINAINPDRVLFLTPDNSDVIALSSEFQRNPLFDTNYGGALWNAYAAGEQTSPTSDSPALVYVLNPEGATNANWLSTNVTINTAAASSTILRAAFAAPLGLTDSSSESSIPTTSAVHQTVPFGSGLSLTSYHTKASDGLARFSISSSDTSKPRALLYAISSANSSAEPGRDYTAIAGVAVLAKGESSFDITVPIISEAFSQLRNGTLSLRVEEISYSDQLESIHLLIETTPAADGGLQPVLSDFTLTPDPNGSTATLDFRADTNDLSADALKLIIARRNSSDTVAASQRQLVSIKDFKPVSGDLPPAYNLQNLDHDVRPNQQVQTSLLLNLKPTGNDPLVSLLGPELNWQSTVQLLNGNQVRFQQDAPLTSWRADSGSGLVTFGLQSGSNNLTLISNAQGGSAGSLNSNNANGATSWQSTEGKAIGSRSITDGQNLKGSDWTPTASRGGVSLALLNLAVDGNQVTATFSGGVTGVFWQADGNAPSVLPAPVAVEVQRLAGYNNSLGFYSVDSITGMVAGINPGENGYLQAALARSQEEDLLLDARTLPAFGATATFNSLPLDTRERYGVLLLQNGDETKIFSSFAAANEGGATQMVSLSNSSNSRVLGIEDMSVAKGLGDNDFNDIIVNIQGVSLGLF